jgi:hypothetical protein
MLNPDFSILNWRPFLELHAIEKLLKRIVYGRHYSKPSDLFFQDHKWQAWARERETRREQWAYAFYLAQFHAASGTPTLPPHTLRVGRQRCHHRASPANSNDIDITMSNLEEMLGDRLTHDEGWDNPAPSKEVLR